MLKVDIGLEIGAALLVKQVSGIDPVGYYCKKGAAKFNAIEAPNQRDTCLLLAMPLSPLRVRLDSSVAFQRLLLLLASMAQ